MASQRVAVKPARFLVKGCLVVIRRGGEECLMACEECGAGLVAFKAGRTQGLQCVECGASVVTTHFSPMEMDETQYEVHCRGDYRDQVHVRAVAAASGGNFLEARTLLQKGLPLVMVGRAQEVLKVRKSLLAVGMACEIRPEFPWQ